MKVGMLIAGFIMLCNPVIYLIDVFPDVIGIALIILGLTKMSYLVGKIERARILYQKLLIVEAVNLFAFPLVAISPMGEKATMALLLAFSMGVLEMVFFIPATVYLFDGIADNGIEYSDMSLFAVKNIKKRGQGRTIEKGRSILTGTRNFVIFFYIFRICATVLPELASLDNGEIRSGGIYLSNFKRLFYVLSFILVAVLAVIFIVRIARFFGRLGKDRTFIQSIKDRFEREVMPRTTLFISKRMKLVLILFGVSLITLIFRDLEVINYGTTTLGCLFFCAAAILMGKYNKLAYAAIPFSVINCGLHYYNNVVSLRYYEEHREIEAIYWVEEAKNAYYSMAGLRIVEFVFALGAAVMLILVLLKVTKDHIAICGIKTESAQYSKARRDAEIYKSVKARLIASIVFAAIAMTVGSIYHYVAISTQAAGALYVLAVAVYIVFAIVSLNAIDDKIYDSELAIA